MTQYLSLNIRRRSTWLDDGGSSSNVESLSRRHSHHNHKGPGNLPNNQLATYLKQFSNTGGKLIKLNVGGQLFRTYENTLSNVPKTRLADLDETSPFYDEKTESYFFDRNPIIFQSILDLYRDGQMHIPHDVCARQVGKDLIFWQLSMSNLADCCKKHYEDVLDEIESYEAIVDEVRGFPRNIYSVHSKPYNNYDYSNSRIKIWEFLDDHASSKGAKLWHAFYMVLIIISIVVYFASTLGSCRLPIKKSIYRMGSESNNSKQIGSDEIPKVQKLLNTCPHPAIQIIELSCLVFFTLEFIFRFLVCPWKCRLLKSVTTYIDLLYIVPSWSVIIMEILQQGTFWQTKHGARLFVVMEAIEIFRVFRIFRFVQHHRGLRMLYLALRSSISELSLLMVFVCFDITIFAGAIYCAEIFSPDYFDNAFLSLWWALITMTTVGYGDMYPTSWLGYLVGSVCAVTGIIIVSLTVPIIVSNFHAYYGIRIPDDDDSERPWRNPENGVSNVVADASQRDCTVPQKMIIPIIQIQTCGESSTDSTESHKPSTQTDDISNHASVDASLPNSCSPYLWQIKTTKLWKQPTKKVGVSSDMNGEWSGDSIELMARPPS